MPYTTDADLPRITDDTMRQELAATRTYTVMILRSGPNFGSPGTDQLIFEHARRNFALREAGLLSIVCPISDASDVHGVGVFNADLAETERIYQADPAVQAGVFTFEVHLARSFPGDSLPT
jgi:hypothetical protein